jgi:ankyrin repeat protein
MNEKEDFLSENISSVNDKELKKELLENQSFNNLDTIDGLYEISQLYNGLNNSVKNKKELDQANPDNDELNNLDFDDLKNINPKDKLIEKTFLYYIEYEKIQEIEQIMNENFENVLSFSYDDMNIVQYASFFNKFNSLKIIIKQISQKYKDNEKILKMINIKNKKGYNALHYSIIRGNNEIYDFLIENGADTTILTNLGYDNIMLSCQTKRTYIFLKSMKNKIINDNLNFDALFDIKDKNNATLLHWSAFSNYLFGIQFLLNHFRKEKNNFKFINFINYKDNNNMTALQYALMNNSNKAIIELTLLDNMDLSSQDNEGRNCYDYSKAMDNKIFENLILMKKYKLNIIKRIIFIFLLIIFNILIYFIILPIINIYSLKIIQLSINLLLIIIFIIFKFIINPGLKKGDKEKFTNILFDINNNNINKESKEINKYCLYCCIKKESPDIKHCPLCDCCVEKIIKHDIFLNICIGKKNFTFFTIYKIIFLIYLLFFIFLGFFSIIINFNENKEIIVPHFEFSFLSDNKILFICSFTVLFLLIFILIMKIGDLYRINISKK